MVAEIDARPGLRDGKNIVEDGLERIGRHQVRDEAGDSALRRRRRLAIRIARQPRPGDILAVAKMEMDIDRTGKNHESPGGNLRARAGALPGSKDRGNPPVGDGDIARRPAAPRKHRVAVPHQQIVIRHSTGSVQAVAVRPSSNSSASSVDTTSAYFDAMSNRLTACEVGLRS